VVGNFPRSYGNERGKPNLMPLMIEKVGRKWLALKGADGGWRGYKVEIGKDYIDGGNYSSPGVIYKNRAAFEEQEQRRRLWNGLREGIEALRWSGPPSDIPTQNIREAARLLGVFLKED